MSILTLNLLALYKSYTYIDFQIKSPLKSTAKEQFSASLVGNDFEMTVWQTTMSNT